MIERTVQDSVKLEVDRSVEERLRTEGMGKAHKVNPQVEGRAGGQKKKKRGRKSLLGRDKALKFNRTIPIVLDPWQAYLDHSGIKIHDCPIWSQEGKARILPMPLCSLYRFPYLVNSNCLARVIPSSRVLIPFSHCFKGKWETQVQTEGERRKHKRPERCEMDSSSESKRDINVERTNAVDRKDGVPRN